MARNSKTPNAEATKVIGSFKSGAAAILEACNIVAGAYKSLEEGEWTEKQFTSFFDQLAKAGIGTGSQKFYPKKGKVTEFNPSLSGTYYEMRAVGECEFFKSAAFKAANKVTSYSTLYRLQVLYNEFADRKTGTPAKNQERAEKQVLALVTQGIQLTRDDVDAAIKKAKAAREKKSLKPQTEQTEAADSIEAPEKRATVQELVRQEAKYDLVVMTPSNELLEEADMSSSSTLEEKVPYQDLRSDGSKVVLIGSGRHQAGLRKMAALSPDITYQYCVRANPDVSAVIDLANETLVFTSHPLDRSSKPKKGETVADFVNRLIADTAQPSARKLRLFADKAEEGWDLAES